MFKRTIGLICVFGSAALAIAAVLMLAMGQISNSGILLARGGIILPLVFIYGLAQLRSSKPKPRKPETHTISGN